MRIAEQELTIKYLRRLSNEFTSLPAGQWFYLYTIASIGGCIYFAPHLMPRQELSRATQGIAIVVRKSNDCQKYSPLCAQTSHTTEHAQYLFIIDSSYNLADQLQRSMLYMSQKHKVLQVTAFGLISKTPNISNKPLQLMSNLILHDIASYTLRNIGSRYRIQKKIIEQRTQRLKIFEKNLNDHSILVAHLNFTIHYNALLEEMTPHNRDIYVRIVYSMSNFLRCALDCNKLMAKGSWVGVCNIDSLAGESAPINTVKHQLHLMPQDQLSLIKYYAVVPVEFTTTEIVVQGAGAHNNISQFSTKHKYLSKHQPMSWSDNHSFAPTSGDMDRQIARHLIRANKNKYYIEQTTFFSLMSSIEKDIADLKKHNPSAFFSSMYIQNPDLMFTDICLRYMVLELKTPKQTQVFTTINLAPRPKRWKLTNENPNSNPQILINPLCGRYLPNDKTSYFYKQTFVEAFNKLMNTNHTTLCDGHIIQRLDAHRSNDALDNQAEINYLVGAHLKQTPIKTKQRSIEGSGIYRHNSCGNLQGAIACPPISRHHIQRSNSL